MKSEKVPDFKTTTTWNPRNSQRKQLSLPPMILVFSPERDTTTWHGAHQAVLLARAIVNVSFALANNTAWWAPCQLAVSRFGEET